MVGQRQSDEREEEGTHFDLSVVMPRKRVGLVRAVMPAKRFGFIAAEDYREDVFFHFERFEPARPGQVPLEEMPVEFELDEVYRRETGKLRVLAVRPTTRRFLKRSPDAMHHSLRLSIIRVHVVGSLCGETVLKQKRKEQPTKGMQTIQADPMLDRFLAFLTNRFSMGM